ncbi:C-type mannose receptor 2 [Nematostella vectensis]|uniref:C-type mannose receptor 2 n=1 Tax=Nematostella vectensis TaxID=45351 RepID=UPI0020770B57|nr:C-type mannose receptor 2 [Nematostella vectensis]
MGTKQARCIFIFGAILLHMLDFPRRTFQDLAPPGFVFESDEYFYKIVFERDDRRTFYEAEEICNLFENGHLASITSQAENEWIHQKIQSVSQSYEPRRFWVGASDRRQYGSFEWIDGKPFIFYAAHYLGARRKKQDYEMCLSLRSSRKDVQWTDEDCYDARGYICKTEGAPKRIVARRRFGYEFDENIWTYKFVLLQDDMLTWPEAEVYCRKTEWGHLLSITSAKEQEKVKQWLRMLRFIFGFHRLWIGASDLVRESKFVWTDGRRFNYTNWQEGEPSGMRRGQEQDCAAIAMYPELGKWEDHYCLQNMPFICKIKMCGERTDLAFAIDASGSMGDQGFLRAKRFVKALIGSFKVSQKGTHVGIIRFSTRAKVMFTFTEHFTHEDVNYAIDDIEYTEGGTKTELALRLARTELFSKQGGSRTSPLIFKLFVLMTDGRSEYFHAVARQAKMLKRSDVHVMAVGIGKYTNQRELEVIASSKSDVIGVVSFRDLMIRMNEIKDKLCEIALLNEKKNKEKEQQSLKKRLHLALGRHGGYN